MANQAKAPIHGGVPTTAPQAPVAATVAAVGPAALANNNTTHNTTPGALVATFGVVLRSPGGSVTTCRSKGAQWPNLGGTPAVCVHPCQGAATANAPIAGTGGTGAAVLATAHNGGTKLWAYQPGAVTVALCPAGMAVLTKLATVKGAPASLASLVALCVVVG